MSAYDDLLRHAEEFNRFGKIAGHRFEKLAPQSPPDQPEPPKNAPAEVGWDGKKINAVKDGTDAN